MPLNRQGMSFPSASPHSFHPEHRYSKEQLGGGARSLIYLRARSHQAWTLDEKGIAFCFVGPASPPADELGSDSFGSHGFQSPARSMSGGSLATCLCCSGHSWASAAAAAWLRNSLFIPFQHMCLTHMLCAWQGAQTTGA